MAKIFSSEQNKMSFGMKLALGVSIGLHVALFVVGMVGLPFLSKPKIMTPNPIAIELVDVADITTTNKPPVKAVKKPEPEEPKKEPPKKENPVKAPPKVEAKEPPKIKPIEKPKEPPKETVKPKPETPPPPDKLEKPKEPEPPKPQEEEKPKEEAIEQEEDFESLMKNLQDPEDSSDSDNPDEGVAEESPDAPIAETTVQSKLGPVTRQLEGCWKINSGIKDVNTMTVTVHFWVNPDRTVKKVEIEDRLREETDAAFAALARSVRWAFEEPACKVLDIPMDEYQLWKDQYITIDFDPSRVT